MKLEVWLILLAGVRWLCTELVVMHVGDQQLGVWRDPAFWEWLFAFLLTLPSVSCSVCLG